MYDYFLKKGNIINKKNFFIGLLISSGVNFFILFLFTLMSKIVEPAKLPKEPIIRFVKIREKPVEIQKKSPPKPKKTETSKVERKNIKGETDGKIIPKTERKPVETPKGNEIKREVIQPEKKAVIPPKEKKLTREKKKEEKKEQRRKITPTPKPQQQTSKKVSENKGVQNKAQKKNIQIEEKRRPILPPPPEKPELDIAKGNTLEPVKEPNISDIGGSLRDLSGISDKDVNPSSVIQGLKSIKPSNRKLSFGEPLSKYDSGVSGTASVRKIEYMPPPPLIKTKLPAPPRNVRVKIWISPDGRVQKAQLLKRTGDPLLDKSIINYLYSWKFNPINSNEIQWAVVNIKFKPQ